MPEHSEPALCARFRLTQPRFHLMKHVMRHFKEPMPLAFSAANPQCRSLAESFGSERLSKINLTHISTFNAANHCGVGIRERYNIVRISCEPFCGRTRRLSGAQNSDLVLLLDPPSESIMDGLVPNAVVVHSTLESSNSGKPSFEILPCPKDDMVVRDPVDHTYPFNTTRGVFSLEGLGDLEGGERYGRRQGCVQNYLDSLVDYSIGSDNRAAPFCVPEIVLVFLWVEREHGNEAHRKTMQCLDHSRWWLARRAAPQDSGPAPVFLHVYNGGERSLFHHLLSSVPAISGMMCVHSPWFVSSETTTAAGVHRGAKDDDPFSPHDDDAERYVDIATALSLCDDDEAVCRLSLLRYFGVSATPLTSQGLKTLLGLLPSLRHLAIYLNHARDFRSVGCLGVLRHLKRAMVHTCPSLTDLQGIEQSTSLTDVNLISCINLSSITPLASLATLQTLRINGCAAVAPSPFMESILHSPVVPGASSTGCRGEAGRSALQQLNYLQLSELDNNCDHLSALRFLPLLTALDLHLTATDNKAVVVIARSCVHLQALSLAECFVISEIEPLAVLPYLSHLLLRNTTITDASLRRFCEASPPSLRVLDVSECDDLTDCRCVSSIQTLKRVNAQGTHVTTGSVYELVKGIVTMRVTQKKCVASLETVDLRGCPQLKHFSATFIKK